MESKVLETAPMKVANMPKKRAGGRPSLKKASRNIDLFWIFFLKD